MAITNEQIEAYMIEAELPFEQVGDGLWLIHDETDYIDNIVLIHNEPVITFRVKLMEAPSDNRLELFTRLLELNATAMVAGAFGLEDEAVVIVDTLQSENLDYNEFQAAIDAIALAIREHYEELRTYAGGKEEQAEEAGV
ncbi:YbjN domain-containing protein [Persicimonas caeni]|uniref:YbjN domain-containing protein n=1 Tax=Persicimonas caeni TaxID=2292766 RepID=A0A4Y6PMG6_PERCE|nr:CesT family type III secretion system chaperone [Persicimonas caeni]QDG49227.1 YbjN domain-containing protein [Persicimonas caeni]QED30448.1 YbjN domain-containing protein [Persicimonas caeni]